MSKLNINAQSFTPPPLPTLSAPAAHHSSHLQAPSLATSSHRKFPGSRSRPGQDGRFTEPPPPPKIKLAKTPSPTPEYGPQTKRDDRRSGWYLNQIKKSKDKKAWRKPASSATSRSITPFSTLSDSSPAPDHPWEEELKDQNTRAWTSVSGIGNGTDWGKGDGTVGYGGVMYSGKRNMTLWEADEQRQFFHGKTSVMGMEVDPEKGFQKGYATKRYLSER